MVMDMGELRGVSSPSARCSAFLGICWWAYRSGNRERFEEDALLPFADEAAHLAKHLWRQRDR